MNESFKYIETSDQLKAPENYIETQNILFTLPEGFWKEVIEVDYKIMTKLPEYLKVETKDLGVVSSAVKKLNFLITYIIDKDKEIKLEYLTPWIAGTNNDLGYLADIFNPKYKKYNINTSLSNSEKDQIHQEKVIILSKLSFIDKVNPKNNIDFSFNYLNDLTRGNFLNLFLSYVPVLNALRLNHSMLKFIHYGYIDYDKTIAYGNYNQIIPSYNQLQNNQTSLLNYWSPLNQTIFFKVDNIVDVQYRYKKSFPYYAIKDRKIAIIYKDLINNVENTLYVHFPDCDNRDVCGYDFSNITGLTHEYKKQGILSSGPPQQQEFVLDNLYGELNLVFEAQQKPRNQIENDEQSEFEKELKTIFDRHKKEEQISKEFAAFNISKSCNATNNNQKLENDSNNFICSSNNKDELSISLSSDFVGKLNISLKRLEGSRNQDQCEKELKETFEYKEQQEKRDQSKKEFSAFDLCEEYFKAQNQRLANDESLDQEIIISGSLAGKEMYGFSGIGAISQITAIFNAWNDGCGNGSMLSSSCMNRPIDKIKEINIAFHVIDAAEDAEIRDVRIKKGVVVNKALKIESRTVGKEAPRKNCTYVQLMGYYDRTEQLTPTINYNVRSSLFQTIFDLNEKNPIQSNANSKFILLSIIGGVLLTVGVTMLLIKLISPEFYNKIKKWLKENVSKDFLGIFYIILGVADMIVGIAEIGIGVGTLIAGYISVVITGPAGPILGTGGAIASITVGVASFGMGIADLIFGIQLLTDDHSDDYDTESEFNFAQSNVTQTYLESWAAGLLAFFKANGQPKFSLEMAQYLIALAMSFSYYATNLEDMRAGLKDNEFEKHGLLYLEGIMKNGPNYIYKTANGVLDLDTCRDIYRVFVQRSKFGYIRYFLINT